MSRHVTHPGHMPDLLNDLHTLRSLANAVKDQADKMRQWQIAAIVATISEEATICISKFSPTDETQPTEAGASADQGGAREVL